MESAPGSSDNPLIVLARELYQADPDNRKDDGYLKLYHETFAPLRERELWLLEIGVAAGCSLLMWRDYFPNAHIVGLDKGPPPEGLQEPIASRRIVYVQGDQSDSAALQRAIDCTAGSGFDIVIDDGAHIGALAQTSFAFLFPGGLKPGGLYFIESFGTGYFNAWADSHPYREIPDEVPERGFQKKFASHQYGMVGFVKQLIDELHAAEIRPWEVPRFGIEQLRMVPNLLMLARAKAERIESSGSGSTTTAASLATGPSMTWLAALFAANEREQLTTLLQDRFAGDPNRARIPELLGWLADPMAPLPPDLALDHAEDRLFLDGIAETKRRLFGPAPDHARNFYTIGREYDFLAADNGRGPEQWSLLQLLNFLSIQRLVPNRRAAVVTSMRDDGIVLLEWIAHYRALGFEGIFIYSNDNEDGSAELLRHLAELGEITFLENVTSVNHEIKIAEHAIQFLPELRDFEWVFFADSDEFLVPGPAFGNSVHNVVDAVRERFPERPPDVILYNWKVFVSGSDYARRPGLLLERYQYGYSEEHVKPFARLAAVYSMRHNHVPKMKPPGLCLNSSLAPVANPGPRGQMSPDYGGGQVNHYWTRSFEEFSLKKARGDRAPPDAAAFRRDFSKFFEWNAPQGSGPSSEGMISFDPPHVELVGKVKQERERLQGLPGVQSRLDEIERAFPRLLARFDHQGGLRGIFEAARRDFPWAMEPGA
jgi:glycosyl transferase family 2